MPAQVFALIFLYVVYGLIYIANMGLPAWRQYGCKFQAPPKWTTPQYNTLKASTSPGCFIPLSYLVMMLVMGAYALGYLSPPRNDDWVAAGYCPVSYFGPKPAHPGDPNAAVRFQGADYLLTNADVVKM